MEIMVRKLKVKEIKNPPKRWWPGDIRVEPYMRDIDKALDRSGLTGQSRIDVYNRAYEAVHKAICDCENKYKNNMPPNKTFHEADINITMNSGKEPSKEEIEKIEKYILENLNGNK